MLQSKEMDRLQNTLSIVREQGLVPLFYHENPETCAGITRSLYEGGVRILEFTNRGSNAIPNFKVLRQLVNQSLPGMQLGIGTVKNEEDAKAFIEAGADFIVSPIVHPGISEITRAAGLLWIPGCLTPTEIALAENLGALLIKIFPGSLVGASYITAIKDIFPNVMFMPTGGVDITRESVNEWFQAGVVAVGMGSKLITKKILENLSYKSLSEASAEALAIVHSVKK
jgi:2-dehydro-3-deoxyphosphogluconate aldolase / (4S)-4-hydroxy-2-oxoglutarate aldolase